MTLSPGDYLDSTTLLLISPGTGLKDDERSRQNASFKALTCAFKNKRARMRNSGADDKILHAKQVRVISL
jgi:hypothetical protein